MINYTTNNNNLPDEQQELKTNQSPSALTEPVDGATLFEELTATFNMYLSLQEYQAEALALWSIFTHCFDAGDIAPKLLVFSPEKRCGKTTLLDVLMGVVWNPILTSNITPAALFRTIDADKGTVMIDEADTFIKGGTEMNGIINCGHRKSSAYVIRTVGENHEPKRFSTWAPTVIAMIGKPKDTIVDRSIIIEMKRKKADEHIERFIRAKVEPKLKLLQHKISIWCKGNFEALVNSDPAIPQDLNDRASDNWRPLLAIADLIGGNCPEIARAAAEALVLVEDDDDSSSVSNLLLSDIRTIFEAMGEKRIRTADILENLRHMDEKPWAEWNRGFPITAHQVAKHLKPFGIKPGQIRFGSASVKGYELSQFEDAFSRYLNETIEEEISPDFNDDSECFDVSDKPKGYTPCTLFDE